jgi:hypothetical protein
VKRLGACLQQPRTECTFLGSSPRVSVATGRFLLDAFFSAGLGAVWALAEWKTASAAADVTWKEPANFFIRSRTEHLLSPLQLSLAFQITEVLCLKASEPCVPIG